MEAKQTEHARRTLSDVAAILERASLLELRNAIQTAERQGQSGEIFWAEINRRLNAK